MEMSGGALGMVDGLRSGDEHVRYVGLEGFMSLVFAA